MAPRNSVGPSMSWEVVEFVVNDVEGDTTSKATRSCRSIVGARYANRMRNRDVNANMGARYSVTALETPAIMMCKVRRKGDQVC